MIGQIFFIVLPERYLEAKAQLWCNIFEKLSKWINLKKLIDVSELYYFSVDVFLSRSYEFNSVYFKLKL